MITWEQRMAKLYKNAIISMEEVFLNQLPLAEPAAMIETTAPLIDASQQELLQKEAYERGYSTGIAEERARTEQEIHQLKKHLQETLAAIPNAIAQNRLDLSQEIADIVLHITQQFFIESQKDHNALNQQINQILAQLNNKHTVELFLHPQEIAALQQGTIQLDAAHLNGLKIKSDESLLLGGCIVKTNHGIFDASIDKQIDQLKEVLIQLKQRGHHATMD